MHSVWGFALSLLIVIVLWTPTIGKKGDQLGYKTTYACEGNTLNIVCNDGVINLIRANYGRFSISICNDHGNLDWRVNCMSFHSFHIMRDICNLKPNCSINVSSDTFIDPCPGTRKYLEVQYQCGTEMPIITPPLVTSTLKPGSGNGSMAVFEEKTPMFTPPSSTSNITHSTKKPAVITTERTSTPFKVPSPPTTVTTKISLLPSSTIAIKETAVDTFDVWKEISPVTKSTTAPTTIVYSTQHYCPPVFSRGINWTWTSAGQTSTVKCPDGAAGYADWYCNFNPVQWSPEEPNLQQCRSLWIENTKRRMEHDSIISVTTELAQMSQSKPLFSSDLKDIGELMKQALYKGVNSMENVLDSWHRYYVLRELLQSFVQTLNNLLDEKQKDAWNDLDSLDGKAVISSLLEALEESALLLAETTSLDGSFSYVKSNVLFSLKVFGLKEEIHFPIIQDIASERDGVYWTAMHDKIFLPSQDLQEYSHHGLVKVVFIAFKNIDEFLKPGSNILHYPRDQYDENITRIINSRIIAASLERTGNPRLLQPVFITLKHIHEENTTNPICVFWDFHSRDWSARGCWVEMTNKTHTICACDHLTNFAVVMEVTNTMASDAGLELIHIVITIGGVIAIICLLIAVIVLYSLRGNAGNSIIIQKNMFLCLLISEAIFIAGINQTSHHITCAIIAGSLQYFFLAAFSWMFFECYQQYVTLISSRDAEKGQARYYYAVAYTLPAIVVGVSALIDPSSYGTKNFCWLHADNYFVFSFVGPAVAIVFGGIVFLCITLCIFWHHISISTTVKGKEETKLANIKVSCGRSITLIVMVSLTWASGLLYINKGMSFLAYLFATSNGLMGIVILIPYCLRNDQVKQNYKEVLRNQYLFTWCHQPKNKEQESQSTVLPAPNRTTSGDHISQQYWNSGMGRNSSSKKSTIPGHLSTMTARIPEGENFSDETNSHVQKSGRNWDTIRSSQRKKPKGCSGESFSQDKDLSKEHVNYQGYHTHPHYRHFAAATDINTQFVDHIYESIDDEEPVPFTMKEKSIISQQFPPPENYYGDHSDLSQHSSSSYGYDQRPLLIATAGIRNAPQFPTSDEFGEPEEETDQGNDSNLDIQQPQFIVKTKLDQATISKIVYGLESSDTLRCTAQNYSGRNYGETSLPDLLQCPAENSAVLAVLEGDKVVSQLQQEDFQAQPPTKYKLSTYC